MRKRKNQMTKSKTVGFAAGCFVLGFSTCGPKQPPPGGTVTPKPTASPTPSPTPSPERDYYVYCKECFGLPNVFQCTCKDGLTGNVVAEFCGERGKTYSVEFRNGERKEIRQITIPEKGSLPT
jgi:hypothetical protein